MAAADGFRTEHDSMGEVRVPASALWGAQTQRAVENFPISGRPIDRRLIRALALVKAEAAVVNAKRPAVPAVDDRIGDAIRKAAEVVATGAHDDQFPVDVFQTGSGTSSNMNANEVIARLAREPRQARQGAPQRPRQRQPVVERRVPERHPPRRHRGGRGRPAPRARAPGRRAAAKADEFAEVVKAGRTHLMDAVPVTLGQEFGGYATQVAQSARRLRSSLPRLGELPIGGTAVGTGLNAPEGFGAEVVRRLAKRTGLPLTTAIDHFAAQSARDGLVEASGQLRVAAVALTKVANDLRWMASGPRTGLAEIRLPDLQPGSSIMPGKVNPVLCEAVTQVAPRSWATTRPWRSRAARATSSSTSTCRSWPATCSSRSTARQRQPLFADRCVAGIEADVERCRTYAEASPAIATSLNPYLGYERTAELIEESQRTGTPIRDLVVAAGELGEDELDRALDALALTRGGVAGT
jgi:fumarate hydratase, class II